MADLFLIFSHEFTPLQDEDARRSLGVDRILDPPPELKEMWSRIPPGLPVIEPYLRPLRRWLARNAAKADYVLLQGDFGTCLPPGEVCV